MSSVTEPENGGLRPRWFAILPILIGSLTMASLSKASATAVFRSSPRPVKGHKMVNGYWGFDERWKLPPVAANRGNPENVTHVVYSQCWALLIRQRPAALWLGVASNHRFLPAWRLFAAYQIFLARARPGETVADIASLYRGAPWLSRQMLHHASGPSMVGKSTGFSIRLGNPGEPGGRLAFALAGSPSLASVYSQLKGEQHERAAAERVTAIGLRIKGPEFRVAGLPTAVRTFWLTEPEKKTGRKAEGQTLDGWAIRHYVLPTANKSARRTAVVAVLSMSEMPARFWAALASDGGLPRQQRAFAETLFLVTGLKPGESLRTAALAMSGFPPLSSWQVNSVWGASGPPPFRSNLANGFMYYWVLPTMQKPPDWPKHRSKWHIFQPPASVGIALQHTIKSRSLRNCLNGHGGASQLADIVVDSTPHWKPYNKGLVSKALKAKRR